MLAGRADTPAARKPRRTKHPYPLGGCVWCGLCGRRMQGQRVNGTAYYRCRLLAGHALGSQARHPRSVNLRENLILGQVETWLARELTARRVTQALRSPPGSAPSAAEPGRASSGAPAGAGKGRQEPGFRQAGRPRGRASDREAGSAAGRLAGAARALAGASADEKAKIFRQFGLKLTYHPGNRAIAASIVPDPRRFPAMPGGPRSQPLLTAQFTLGSGPI
jgi:hypothetical protein